ncbi:MAG: EAL domain-containing protein [Pseudomonadota bacterium]
MRLPVTLGGRLSAVLALAFGVIVVGALLGFLRVHDASVQAQRLQVQWTPRVEVLRELRLNVERAVLSGTRALQTTNFRHLAEIATERRATEAAIDALLERYAAAAETGRERELLGWFTAAWSAWRDGYTAMQRHLETGDGRQATRAFEAARIQAHQPAVEALLSLITLAEAASAEAGEMAESVFHGALMLAVAAVLAGALLAAGVILWVRRHVAVPLTELSRTLDRLAAGELDVDMAKVRRADEIGALAAAVTSYRDSLVSGRALASAAEQQRERLRIAVANMPLGLCMTDVEGAVVVSNQRFADTYGLDPESLRPGVPLPPLGGHAGGADATMTRRAGSQIVTLENDRIVRVVEQALPDGGWVAIHEDITAQRAAEARIAHMAHHDALTGLPNRVRLRDRLERAFARSKQGRPAALLYLDLDRFKAVNDTLGHPVGDALLQAVTGRLLHQARAGDLVARLGGDEFAVLMAAGGGREEAASLALRIVAALSEPYQIQDQQLVIGASVGIALLPEDGEDPDTLLRHADLALYCAKAEGRGTWRFFDRGMTLRAQARRVMELELRHALAAGEFELWYQPMVRLPGRALRGFEAMLRWSHPQRGMLQSEEFLGLAEEVGLMVPIGDWVLRQACRDAAGWPGALPVSVNIVAAQCALGTLVAVVDDALAQSGLPASRLKIEITEATVPGDAPVVAENLRSLKARGIGLAMDDFGTGFASIGQLRRFPFDTVKIDCASAGAAEEGSAGTEAVRAIAALCQSLGLAVAAGAVETEAQLAAIAEICTIGQGALFGAPLPAAEVRRLLASRHGAHLKVVAA